MTTQHSTPHLPVLCASQPGQIEPHHLRIVLTSLPTLSTLPPRVALAVNLAGLTNKEGGYGMNHRERTCGHCGEPGAVLHTEYVGGKGYEDRWLCEDRAACWHRWDRAHSLPTVSEREQKRVA